MMTLRRLIACVLAAGMLCLAPAGCRVAGALWYKAVGPEAFPPKFSPTKTQPLLIMVENAHATSGSVPEADELTQVMYDELKDNLYKDLKTEQKDKPINNLVDPEQVHLLRAAHPAAFQKMSISEIGRKVGAKQIIYVTLRQFVYEMPAGGDNLRLKMNAAVRVVDADTTQTIWPDGEEGEVFEYESPYSRITAETNEHTLKREVLRKAGTEIARWFYPYQADSMSEENRDFKLR
jgi:hypothetical protein